MHTRLLRHHRRSSRGSRGEPPAVAKPRQRAAGCVRAGHGLSAPRGPGRRPGPGLGGSGAMGKVLPHGQQGIGGYDTHARHQQRIHLSAVRCLHGAAMITQSGPGRFQGYEHDKTWKANGHNLYNSRARTYYIFSFNGLQNYRDILLEVTVSTSRQFLRQKTQPHVNKEFFLSHFCDIT